MNGGNNAAANRRRQNKVVYLKPEFPLGLRNTKYSTPIRPGQRASNQSGVKFVLVDPGVGMTFMDVAEASRVAGTTSRNHSNARRAYDAVSRTVLQGLGFDLEDEQIEAFETYDREYAAFAQIVR